MNLCITGFKSCLGIRTRVSQMPGTRIQPVRPMTRRDGNNTGMIRTQPILERLVELEAQPRRRTHHAIRVGAFASEIEVRVLTRQVTCRFIDVDASMDMNYKNDSFGTLMPQHEIKTDKDCNAIRKKIEK